MARYPGIENERRVAPDTLRTVLSSLFQATGMSAADATIVADTLVVADLRGIHSHGSMRIPNYIGKVTVDGVDPRGRPSVARDAGAALTIDGGNAMGQVACSFAMERAIERARETGVCFAAVGNSNHCGAIDYYVLKAADAGMIGIGGTNALPTMAPWGGRERIVGINPLGIAIPAKGEPHICLDIAFGATARGRIQVYHQKGERLPEGWCLDRNGAPTTDPVEALAGLIAPVGAYKGTGMGIMMGLLSTVLTGAAYGPALGDVEGKPNPGVDGQFMLAVDISAFDAPDAVRGRTDAAIRQIMNSERAAGSDEVLPPGRLEAELTAEFTRDGIPLNDETLDGIRRMGEQLGVDTGAVTGT
jgi:LDH2 family malate/lactate/ureidoglycolate dehydrogenase